MKNKRGLPRLFSFFVAKTFFPEKQNGLPRFKIVFLKDKRGFPRLFSFFIAKTFFTEKQNELPRFEIVLGAI
ncbi:hypothetical protein E4633_13965 [Geomonas terrae]|uniref:Uncharacterized protein n=1 Tax=Geomonas terrae TaxID=2562681 RepID=A0A4S1CDE5_9BACT|nr:hypothetical protein [Geomonas terrae]TGU71429.1 hypothetical protein E4633_13965 [Geomonas terrae]